MHIVSRCVGVFMHIHLLAIYLFRHPCRPLKHQNSFFSSDELWMVYLWNTVKTNNNKGFARPDIHNGHSKYMLLISLHSCPTVLKVKLEQNSDNY